MRSGALVEYPAVPCRSPRHQLRALSTTPRNIYQLFAQWWAVRASGFSPCSPLTDSLRWIGYHSYFEGFNQHSRTFVSSPIAEC
nr:MAG TPA: hypothetical protein [Caudoviricetes sp.]